ncbi:MAG TPA: hypothetical protein VGE77_08860 [Nocardioides sp.]
MSRLPDPTPRRTSRSTALLTALAAVLVGLLGPAAGTAAAAEDDTVSWAITPATADGPDGRVSLRHVVEPGASVSDAVAVTNLGAAAADFEVVTGDGRLGEGGAFDIAEGTPEAGGSWVRVDGTDGGVLRLEPGETRVLPVTVTVPAEATPGDHPAGIVVARSSGDGSVRVTHRIGVRLHLQVAGDLRPALEVADVRTTFDASLVPFAPGDVEVRYEIRNTGNVRLGAASAIDALGLRGDDAADAAAQVDELLPGDTVAVTVTRSAWPVVRLSGDVEVQGRVVGEDTVSPGGPATASFGVWAVSWTGLLVLLVLAGGVVVAVRRRSTRRDDADSSTPADREPVGADA